MNAETPASLTVLPGGMRVASEHVAHLHGVVVGLRVLGGSREEPDKLAGISHVLEHMLFRGTERRTSREIAETLDAVGGQLDAYTTQEYTGFGVRVLPEHLPLALDILADLIRNPRLDDADLLLEKQVILDECRSIDDSPEEYIHELYNRQFWPDHPLGRPVIGWPETVTAIARDDLVGHLRRHYTPSRMIAAAAGPVEHERLVEELVRAFGEMQDCAGGDPSAEPKPALTENWVERPTEQVHFCLGAAGPDESDPERWSMRVLALILGGSMSSRLFQEIREKRGLCYSIGAESLSFRDAGQFVIYADTSPERVKEVRGLVADELARIVEEGVSGAELERARNQVRAATLLSQDDAGARVSRMTRSLMFHDRLTPLSELVAQVEQVTPEACRDVARRYFGEGKYAFAAIGPRRARRRRRDR